MNYVQKLRRECSRLIRANTFAQDADNGRGAYRVPRPVAERIESIIDGDSARLIDSSFYDIMQDAGFHRDVTGDPRRKPGHWVTGGRTSHGGEEVTDWVPHPRFWTLLTAIISTHRAT
ncbi:hypothetical protein [Ruegeria atlantica]|uniref:hypothetical protein n=1 Tax=Ruegeria atlantica TaxID=81569 RepID=UPI002494EB65|nr:hypothetical protein [Ruegeria atlantica]